MDFELSNEQEELRDGLRRLLADRCDHDRRRQSMGLPGAIDRELWSRLAGTGVFSLRLPVESGGIGAGLAEAVIVEEEVGRAAVPGPVVATTLLAGLVPGASDGSTVITAVYEEGASQLIEHLEGSDLLALITPDGIWAVPAGGLEAEPVAAPLDPLTPVHRARLTESGELLVGPETAALIRREGTLLTAAAQVGLAAAATELGSAYAKERTQFGRPIGAFQAVKHMLADALAETEVARAAVHAAAVSSDESAPSGELSRSVAVARILASRAAQRATRACIQVHGGMGYTWEVDAHLYLKRALVLDTHFDPPAAAREQVLAHL